MGTQTLIVLAPDVCPAIYIQKQFVGLEMQEVANIALKNEWALRTVLTVANEIRCRVLSSLNQQINDELQLRGLVDWTLVGELTREKYSHIRIKCPEATQYSVSFEFLSADYQALEYGILKEDRTLPDLLDVRECLNGIIGRSMAPGDWRPVRRKFEPYSNWPVAVEPWVEIQNGAMARRILDKTIEIYAALRGAGLLHRLSGNAP